VLEEFVRDHEIVGEARGSGLMLGIEMVDRATGEPSTRAATALQRGAIERGLIVERGGRGDSVVRLTPPLNVSRETLDQGFDILSSVLAEITSNGSSDGQPRLREAV
jgi:diaminobutyrate-2-oxoglutarate transaminase